MTCRIAIWTTLFFLLVHMRRHPIVIECAPLIGNSEFGLLVLHTNDMHSRIAQIDKWSNPCNEELSEQGKCYGGFARLKNAVGQARLEADQQNFGSLFLNAGDNFQGTVYYTLYKWKIIAEFIRELGIDVMSLGNHEFDDGIEGLAPYLGNITIPTVVSNLDFSAVPELQLPILTPSKIVNVKGRNVGIIGYLTPETEQISNPKNVVFKDEIQSISEEAKKLKAQGVDIIIALGHSGYEIDLEIAKQVPDISLVVGGHTNTFLYSPKDKPPSTEMATGEYPMVVVQNSGRKVPVVQAYAYTKYLGKLWITFDAYGNAVSWNGNPMLLDSSISQDEEVKRKVEAYASEIEKEVKQVIARTNVFLEGDETKCRVRECNLGNFVADSFVDYMASRNNDTKEWTDSSIALINGGSVRTNVFKGEITLEHVLVLAPFQNELYKVTLTGKTIRKAIEYSVRRYRIKQTDVPYGWAEYLQFSGVKVVYDFANPENERAVSIKVRCSNCTVPMYSPLQDDQDYVVLMSSYMFNGGDGFSMIPNEMKDAEQIGYTDTDAISLYMKKLKFIYPEDSGRIIMKNVQTAETTSSASSQIFSNFKISSALSFYVSICCLLLTTFSNYYYY